MLCGALSRTVAALAVHPLHVMKVNLQRQKYHQSTSAEMLLTPTTLTRGLGTQLFLTLPHGALSFAVTESTKKWLLNYTTSHSQFKKFDPMFDLIAASVSSMICSLISIPQMLLTDRIMIGLYPNLWCGLQDVVRSFGVRGLYQGWVPGMIVKLPSSAITWMLYQQLSRVMF